MNFASTMVLVSLLVPSKGWYSPQQPLEVTMHASGEYAFMLNDFSGRDLDPTGSPDVKSDKPVDVKKMFQQLGTPGTYVLYGVKKGAETTKDFVGTPLVIEVRPDPRRGAPPGPMTIKVEPLCYATMSTDYGDMTMAFYYDVAPNNIANFLSLAQGGFYDGLTFNRIIKDFIIQSGDPRGDGTGGPGYMVDAEFGDRAQFAGVISMARSADPNEAPGVMPRPEFANSAGSQFFICLNYTNTQQLDRRYTAIGKVMSGMETVNKIGAVPLSDAKEGKPTTQPVIKKITVKGVTAKENPYPALIESATTMPTDAQSK